MLRDVTLKGSFNTSINFLAICQKVHLLPVPVSPSPPTSGRPSQCISTLHSHFVVSVFEAMLPPLRCAPHVATSVPFISAVSHLSCVATCYCCDVGSART